MIKHPHSWPGAYKVTIDHPIEYRYRYSCAAPLCFYSIMAATEQLRDDRAANHECPFYGGGHTTLSWNVMSDQYLTPIWEMLDAVVDSIKGTPAGSESLPVARAEARAYANTLALLMQPFFTTQQEISQAALARWEARQRGEEPQTAGLGKLKWKRPGGLVGDPDHPSWVTKEYDPNHVQHSLTDDQVASVKAAKGAVPVAMLVAAFGVSAKVIESIQREN